MCRAPSHTISFNNDRPSTGRAVVGHLALVITVTKGAPSEPACQRRLLIRLRIFKSTSGKCSHFHAPTSRLTHKFYAQPNTGRDSPDATNSLIGD